MHQNLKTLLIVTAVLAVAAMFVATGFFLSQRMNPGFGPRYNTAEGTWGLSRLAGQNCTGVSCTADNSPLYFGRGMMGKSWNNNSTQNYGMGSGMMGNYGAYQNAAGETLTLDSAQSAFNNYLDNLGNDDLEISEIMLFNQNAYAIVSEKSTGTGAMELLVDPDTLTVFPEYGPNRMWNTKYGMMGGSGRRSGSFGICGTGFANGSDAISADMSISREAAAGLASDYLAANIEGAELDVDGTTFYGYYTFDYMQDGQMAGMLSVNGYNGQVWLHTWHGQFIEEVELD
jgi:hypothetical protein